MPKIFRNPEKSRPLLLEEMEVTEDDTILDIGCGDGSFLADLAQEKGVTQSRMYGIETTEEAVDLARKTHETLKVEISSIDDIPSVDGFFDIVIVSMGCDRFKDLVNFIDEVQRVLSPGGRVYVPGLALMRAFPPMPGDSEKSAAASEKIADYLTDKLTGLMGAHGFTRGLVTRDGKQQVVMFRKQ